MSLLKWDIEKLKSELNSHEEIKGWIVQVEHLKRRERYFMNQHGHFLVDQDRETESEDIHLRIMVKLPNNPERQGEISKRLFRTMDLGPQIDSGIFGAKQTSHKNWSLAEEVPTELNQVQSCDPRIAEDLETVMTELTSQIKSAATQNRGAQFCSSELFVSEIQKELMLSNGLTHRSSQSRIYTEAAYSAKDENGNSDEFLQTSWGVSLDDINIEEVFYQAAERSLFMLKVEKPQPGSYPVIVDSEVLGQLFFDYTVQLSSANIYNGLPAKRAGDPLVSEAKGDLITLKLDPSLPFGADTRSISNQGVVQDAVELVKENQVLANSTDKKHSDYLGNPVTSTSNNVVVNAGSASFEDLTKSGDKVLEILQFSGLFSDANSGTFSSEIRLGRIYDRASGSIQYIKGGSLSGSLFENFTNARFSSDRVKTANFSTFGVPGGGGVGYFGPKFALLNDVSVVG